jgi:hypothetical protein
MIFYFKQNHGIIQWSNQRALFDWLLSHGDYKGSYIADIQKEKSRRSLSQNAYLWGVVYKTISDYNGDTIEDLHEHFVRHLLPPKFIKVMGKEIKIPASTTELNKIQFGDYIERIRAEVAPMGIVIPEANNEKEFEIQSIYPENNLGKPLI